MQYHGIVKTMLHIEVPHLIPARSAIKKDYAGFLQVTLPHN